jgi:hypothetical protein
VENGAPATKGGTSGIERPRGCKTLARFERLCVDFLWYGFLDDPLADCLGPKIEAVAKAAAEVAGDFFAACIPRLIRQRAVPWRRLRFGFGLVGTLTAPNIRWSMVTDAQAPSPMLSISSMGHPRGGREIPMAKDLWQSLVELQAFKPAAPEDRIIFSERDIGISPKALAIWFLIANWASRAHPDIAGAALSSPRLRVAPHLSAC